jgi:hypothetical protein
MSVYKIFTAFAMVLNCGVQPLLNKVRFEWYHLESILRMEKRFFTQITFFR